mmetsp:Transcript_47508/g.88195  ORF Transcript_47508/g.88195 Transcript_47508/m.88195 type:complete len:249 (-) Transcript_47508:489-1235(-)
MSSLLLCVMLRKDSVTYQTAGLSNVELRREMIVVDELVATVAPQVSELKPYPEGYAWVGGHGPQPPLGVVHVRLPNCPSVRVVGFGIVPRSTDHVGVHKIVAAIVSVILFVPVDRRRKLTENLCRDLGLFTLPMVVRRVLIGSVRIRRGSPPRMPKAAEELPFVDVIVGGTRKRHPHGFVVGNAQAKVVRLNLSVALSARFGRFRAQQMQQHFFLHFVNVLVLVLTINSSTTVIVRINPHTDRKVAHA